MPEVKELDSPAKGKNRVYASTSYFKKVLFHYAHIQADGNLDYPGCRVCKHKLEKPFIEVAIEVPEPSVVPSTGSDEPRVSAPPPDSFVGRLNQQA